MKSIVKNCLTPHMILFVLLYSIVILGGCSSIQSVSEKKTSKLQVIATLFPQYDYVRQIAGDTVDITLLIKPGMDSHSFDPSPEDMIHIANCDLFIYTGGMDTWVDTIIQGLDSAVMTLDVSSHILLDRSEEEHEHGKEETADPISLDPHVWTSPINAKIMAENITLELCRLAPENKDLYNKNCNNYLVKLDQLNESIHEVVLNSDRKEMFFGSRFPFYYFAKEYGIDYYSAFDSCGENTEPSVKTITWLINEMKAKDIPVIFYEEFTEPKVAKTIQESTGAKMLQFHSCHNVTKDELDSGETYLSLMQRNVVNLKEGLN